MSAARVLIAVLLCTIIPAEAALRALVAIVMTLALMLPMIAYLAMGGSLPDLLRPASATALAEMLSRGTPGS